MADEGMRRQLTLPQQEACGYVPCPAPTKAARAGAGRRSAASPSSMRRRFIIDLAMMEPPLVDADGDFREPAPQPAAPC